MLHIDRLVQESLEEALAGAAASALVAEGMDVMDWAEAPARRKRRRRRPDSSLPGRRRTLGTIAIPAKTKAGISLPPGTAGKRGFVYDILDARGNVLDVGSATTPAHLRKRLYDKRRSLPGAARARIHYVQGVPTTRDPRVASMGGVERKILHCHELLRQYGMHRAGLLSNYDPSSVKFDPP